MCKVSARWYSLLLGAAFTLGIPTAAFAQTSLTWAKIEQLRNRVHLVPSNQRARLARTTDVMNVGDALRTASSSRAELRFNDGSLARIGEQATFRFTPNTRNFQLSNGTVLLLIPPGRGRTTIQTPNAVTGIQGSALFVRVRCLAELTVEGYCSSPITLVGALTNNPSGAMMAYTESGSQQQPIYAGEMVVIEGNRITQRHEFDLRTFYETSGLVKGLDLDSPTPPETLSEDLQAVWQEIQDALKLQGDFDEQGSAEEIVENPAFIAPLARTPLNNESESSDSIFAGFPNFDSSPAASFHIMGQPIATSQPDGTYTDDIVGNSSTATTADGSVIPVTSARFVEFLNIDTTQETNLSSVTTQPAVPTTVVAPAAIVPSTTVVNPTNVPTGSSVAPSAVIAPEAPVVVTSPAAVVDLPTPASTVSKPPVVIAPPTPTVSEPTGVIPAVIVPEETVITPAITPEAVVSEPAPIVTNPPPEIVTVPESVATPSSVVQPELTPVVTEPTVPTITEQPITPVAEADQVPITPTTRTSAPTNNFHWGNDPANNPEVVLPSLNISIPDSTQDNNLESTPLEPN